MKASEKLRVFFVLSLEALLLCDILVLFNLIIVSLFASGYPVVLYYTSLVTVLEGGLGLVLGGLSVVAAGPSITKVQEKLVHGEPWSAKRARESEARARVFFFFSAYLIVIGFLISA